MSDSGVVHQDPEFPEGVDCSGDRLLPSLYILAGFAWPRPESEESAMKYFILGAFSSSIFVYGVALIYGATGTTSLPGVVEVAAGGTTLLLLAGAALMLVGFGFKIAAAPFHMWTPDVYEGAPTVVTAFMSVGAKVGGFAALLRILMVALPTLGDTWGRIPVPPQPTSVPVASSI